MILKVVGVAPDCKPSGTGSSVEWSATGDPFPGFPCVEERPFLAVGGHVWRPAGGRAVQVLEDAWMSKASNRAGKSARPWWCEEHCSEQGSGKPLVNTVGLGGHSSFLACFPCSSLYNCWCSLCPVACLLAAACRCIQAAQKAMMCVTGASAFCMTTCTDSVYRGRQRHTTTVSFDVVADPSLAVWRFY